MLMSSPGQELIRLPMPAQNEELHRDQIQFLLTAVLGQQEIV